MNYKYRVLFTADVIDPQDPEYLRIDGAAIKASKRFGYKRTIKMIDGVETIVFLFPTKEHSKSFFVCPEHMEAFKNVDRFYRSFNVIREEI